MSPVQPLRAVLLGALVALLPVAAPPAVGQPPPPTVEAPRAESPADAATSAAAAAPTADSAEGAVEAPEAPAELPEGYGTPATGWVRDGADLLPDDLEAELNRRLADHEAATSNQIVVETVLTTGGVPIEEFTLAEATRLGIGQKGRDNGVLFLVARDDRRARIEVGYGLEEWLTDALSGRILRHEVVPRFREGDYPAGITSGVDALLGALAGIYRGSPLDHVPVVSNALEWVRQRLDRLPPLSTGDQVFFGIFLFVFGPIVSLILFAWLPWKKVGAGLGLGIYATVAGTIVWHYPWMLGALGILVALALVVGIQNRLRKAFPKQFGPGGAFGGGGSSGGRSGSSSSYSSSSSSSSRSFSGGGGSFGGGGASASW